MGDHKEINEFEKIIITVIFKSEEKKTLGSGTVICLCAVLQCGLKITVYVENPSVINSNQAQGETIDMGKFG